MLALPLVLVALFARLAAAISHPQLKIRGDILSPDNDPFYKPPSGWKDHPTGTVFRSRSIKPALLTFIEVKVEHAYEILYRTTGTHESEPSYTVTTVLVPYNAKRDKLAAPLTFMDASGLKCVPSYTIRKGSDFPGDLSMNYQLLLMEQVLEKGYISTIPDYQGPKRVHPIGSIEGRQVLDGIKATINYDKLNLNKNTAVVTTGYSGGAVAASWAAQLHPSYAPSINAVGFSFGGTPVNETAEIIRQDGTKSSAWVFSGLVGIAYAYDDLLEWITPRLTKKGREAFNYLRENCLVNIGQKYGNKKLLSETYIRGGTHLLQEPIMAKILSQMNLGTNKSLTPSAPVLMVHAKNDTSAPFSGAHQVAKWWTERGADVVLEADMDPKISHSETQLANVPTMLLFMEERFANKPFPKGFHLKKVTKMLEDENFDKAGLDVLVEAIKNILGGKIGPANKKLNTHLKLN